MKIQTSRESHSTDKRYAGVYQQQGRMITDADWNELMDIVTERRREALGDVVQHGVPKEGGLHIHESLVVGVRIHPGHLYADGALARLPGNPEVPVPYAGQPDFPEPPQLPTAAAYKLYADVWDRTLTSLEDPGVRDAALHGADTCARTQTMVQVKWCPENLKPEESDVNPKCGNALLTLKLRKARTVTDACDPCAAEELGDDPTRVGNYLFRVEVHDAVWNAQQKEVTQLTLKWSSENGAEQYRLLEGVPEAYQVDDWAFELFSDTTERQLGVHLATGAGPNFPHRGKLGAGYPDTLGAYQYVRRWDGFVVLDRAVGGWTMDAGAGVDRGSTLSRVFTNNGNDAEVVLDGNACTMNLKGIELTLDLDRVFVAGDYWTAPVREAIHKPKEGENEVLIDALPTGIVHHYLTLGQVTQNGGPPPTTIDAPPSDAARRRLEFPSLTTLMANDVGLDADTCDRLYREAENVQQALKNLCDIDADDIAYTDPACPPSADDPPTVRSLFEAALGSLWLDVDDDGRTTVKNVLDALLCQLDAAKIPYDPTATHERWQDVIDEAPLTDPKTVQDALDTLVENLESSDIRYKIPTCPPLLDNPRTFKDLLAVSGDTDIKALWDKVLCHLDAAKIPYDPKVKRERWEDVTEGGLGSPAKPDTVQEALDSLVENLESGDIRYTVPVCPPLPDNPRTLKDLLAVSGKTDIKALWDKVLCYLDAAKIPYDPKVKRERWEDVTEGGLGSPAKPDTVQEALDSLVENLESGDIRYELPTCADTPGEPPRFKDLLALPNEPTNVKKLWDEVLCRLSAATVPVGTAPSLEPPLNVPTVKTVQDALNALAKRGGRGGLAAILEQLADAIGIMPDDKRRDAMLNAPVTGEQSIAEATYGLVVDLLRIAAAFALEYIDLKGIVITPEGELRIGTSASVNLLGTIRPEARAFANDQIRSRTDLWDGLKADFKNVFWCVLAEFLASKKVRPEDVAAMGKLYGSETGYNGPAARLAFLENVYHPLFGSTDLDHTTLAKLRALVLEFLALLWERVTLDVFINEPPAYRDCLTEMKWLQAEDVQRVWRRVREPDGLIRFHSTASSTGRPGTPQLAIERLGKGSTWIWRDNSIERYLHPQVVEALAPTVLRRGQPCPDPSDILQLDQRFQLRHVAPAVFSGEPALEVVFTDPLSSIYELMVLNVAKLPSAGETIQVPADLPPVGRVRLRPESRMVLGDGRHSPVVHLQRQMLPVTMPPKWRDVFAVVGDVEPRILETGSDASVLAVYNLAIDPKAGPSHVVIVETSTIGQRLMLVTGSERPWYGTNILRVVAHVALHEGVAVVGVAHDQLILQVVQPTGSDEGAKWVFVPFRTLAESLWGTDRARFEGFWNTLHPDGKPLFESLDGSVTPPITPPPGTRPPLTILEPPTEPLPGTRPPLTILEPPTEPLPGTRPPLTILEPPTEPPLGTRLPTPEPLRGQPLDIAGAPLFALDLPPFGGRLARGGPLPFFDGVVRRTGPAGPEGWLTVLAEDEILGLYLSFQDLLPRAVRRYHVNHAATALGAVAGQQIVIGDVTETALQFDLGAVAKV